MKRLLLPVIIGILIFSCTKPKKIEDNKFYLQNRGGDSCWFTIYQSYDAWQASSPKYVTYGVAAGQKFEIPEKIVGKGIYFIDWHNGNYMLNNWRTGGNIWHSDSFNTYQNSLPYPDPSYWILFRGLDIPSVWESYDHTSSKAKVKLTFFKGKFVYYNYNDGANKPFDLNIIYVTPMTRCQFYLGESGAFGECDDWYTPRIDTMLFEDSLNRVYHLVRKK